MAKYGYYKQMAANEVATLLLDGYETMFATDIGSFYVKLRHTRNFAIMSVYANDNCMIIRKNGQIVKKEENAY